MRQDQPTVAYRFGRCELQPDERRLLVDGVPVALPSRAFDVLLALVEQAPHLVSKDALVERVWPRLVVEENNLQQQISVLRRVLGADCIATVAGHGYRFALASQRIRAEGTGDARTRLPQALTSFIGREREIAEASRLLASSRLLTLVGMGGIGKTRLSLQLAANADPGEPDGVCFADLAPIREPALVARQLAQAMGVQEQPGEPLLQTLVAFARTRHALVVLDNCEHLAQTCAALVARLLAEAPALRILATSREPLHVPGEQLFRLAPMAVHDGAAMGHNVPGDAMRLFIDRVRLHRPDFAPQAYDLRVLEELCTRLEGIPLALELAAARMRTLDITDLNERLRDRFKLLSGGSHQLAERQQTLRALLNWSYELLAPSERRLCERLSVFVGGFDLAAAEAVCGVEPLDADGILELLTSLVDKSMILVEPHAGRMRYRMLETMCEYAQHKLDANGEADTTAAMHCMHYLGVAKAANQESAREHSAWGERLEGDLANLRAAVACALAGGVDPVIAVKLEVALLRFRLLRGHVDEGRRNIDSALALPAVQASPVAHAHAMYAAAALAVHQGECQPAIRMLEACLALRLAIGNRTDVAATHSTLALVRLQSGDALVARSDSLRALALFRELGDRLGEAISLLHLGQIEMRLDDDPAAQTHVAAGLRIAGEIGHTETASEAERLLGEITLAAGDVAAARRRFAVSQAICQGAGDMRGEALAKWWLCRSARAADDAGAVDLAVDHALHEAMRAFRSFGMKAETLGCLEDLAGIAAARADPSRAVRVCAAATGARQRLGLPRDPRAERAVARLLSRARAELGDEAFDAALQQGGRMDVDAAVADVLPGAAR